MKRKRQSLPVIRVMLVVGTVASMAAGVAYAALQSQQSKFTGNTIQTATANLLVSDSGSNYSSSQTGFTFANLIPGGQAMPLNGYQIYLKNAGGAPLSLRLAVSSPPSNPDGADLSKVTVILTPPVGQTMSFTLQALVDSAATGGLTIANPSQLNPNVVQQYAMRIQMSSDAVTGPGATIGNVDFSFSGVVVNN